MRFNSLLFTFLLFSFAAKAQVDINLSLVSNLSYPVDCNDIWGYVAPDGTEYAIVGTVDYTSIVSLADPANPVEVHNIPGSNSLWRDMKNWEDFVYVTTDSGQDGLLIIDMSGAPDDITSEYWKPMITPNGGGNAGIIGDLHNIYIDEKGYAYLSGSKSVNSGGVLIFDVFTDPGNPIFVGNGTSVYSHDNFVRGDTLWSADISAGYFSVQDVSDKGNVPAPLAIQQTTTVFTHNCWLSDDGNYLFTTDEKPNAFVDAYDVSDLMDIKLLDSYQPQATKGSGVIPHNTHYLDGYLITSWYTDGVVVFDARKPDNLVQVAAYDTYDGPDGGFNGCWGAYPFLPSGLLLASDINSGLYVFQPEYQRAAYLEGNITDAADGSAIQGATIRLTDIVETTASSDFMGDYKTGYANAGTFPVQVFKAGYLPKDLEATLTNGEVTILNAQLEKAVPFNLDIKLINAANGNPISLGSITLSNDFETFGGQTNNTGVVSISDFIEGGYTVIAGAWGFLQSSESVTIDANTGVVEIALTRGYQDDFFFDLGWESTVDGASSGMWELGIPIGTNYNGSASNPGEDIDGDFGESCYVTDNRGGNAGAGDVDGGEVILTSPTMDLTIYNEPLVNYYTWFFNAGGNSAANDSLIVSMSNGSTSAILEVITESNGAWRPQSSFKVSDYLEVTNNMTISFLTMDQQNAGHLVEGAVDAFIVTEGVPVNTLQPALTAEMNVLPNPFSTSFSLDYSLENGIKNPEVVIHNTLGQEVYREKLANDFGTLSLGASLRKGIYFVTIMDDQQRSKVIKVVKE